MNTTTVLLAEDDDKTRKKINDFIEKEGFECLRAEDGETALDLFHAHSPEIVLTDINMPKLGGLSLTEQIKAKAPETQVILITAQRTTETVISAIRDDVLDLLGKPIDLGQLSGSLARARERLREELNHSDYPRVLVADDEPDTRQSLKTVLEKENYRVVTAENGVKAVEIFKNITVDLALIDIKMPEKDGIEALTEMKEHSDDFEAIIITGYGDEENSTEALRQGAINFLRKPVDINRVIALVDNALDTQQLNRSLEYRERQVELAQDVIAQFTGEKFAINLGELERFFEQNQLVARHLLRVLPFYILVVDSNRNVRFVNENLVGQLGARPEQFDRKFIDELREHSIVSASGNTIENRLEDVLSGETDKLTEYGSLGNGDYCLMGRLEFETNSELDESAVLAFKRPTTFDNDK